MSADRFIEARLAEVERAARGAAAMFRPIGEHKNVHGDWVPIGPVGSSDRDQVERSAAFYQERGARNVEVVTIYDPARVLAEVAALRAVVKRCSDVGALMPSEHLAQGILRHIADIWADHPDHEDWT